MRTAIKYMGNSCKYGHDGLRYERTGSCVHCALLYALKQKVTRKAKIEIVEEPIPVGQGA